MSLLRLWFVATALFLVATFIWVFVPVLVPLIAVALGLGGLVAVIVCIARAAERRLGGGGP